MMRIQIGLSNGGVLAFRKDIKHRSFSDVATDYANQINVSNNDPITIVDDFTGDSAAVFPKHVSAVSAMAPTKDDLKKAQS